jgi:hypothetical protein
MFVYFIAGDALHVVVVAAADDDDAVCSILFYSVLFFKSIDWHS